MSVCKYCERAECDTDCSFADRHTDAPARKTAAQWRALGAEAAAVKSCETVTKLRDENGQLRREATQLSHLVARLKGAVIGYADDRGWCYLCDQSTANGHAANCETKA